MLNQVNVSINYYPPLNLIMACLFQNYM